MYGVNPNSGFIEANGYAEVKFDTKHFKIKSDRF